METNMLLIDLMLVIVRFNRRLWLLLFYLVSLTNVLTLYKSTSKLTSEFYV